MISLLPNGLASKYLKNKPKTLRIKADVSKFQIPEKDPLVMIGNGTGMAPFRSIVEFVKSLPENQRIKLDLYFLWLTLGFMDVKEQMMTFISMMNGKNMNNKAL